MTEQNWKTFRLESSFFIGIVDTPEKWAELVEDQKKTENAGFSGPLEWLTQTQMTRKSEVLRTPTFKFMEHTSLGGQTLLEFFAIHAMSPGFQLPETLKRF